MKNCVLVKTSGKIDYGREIDAMGNTAAADRYYTFPVVTLEAPTSSSLKCISQKRSC